MKYEVHKKKIVRHTAINILLDVFRYEKINAALDQLLCIQIDLDIVC